MINTISMVLYKPFGSCPLRVIFDENERCYIGGKWISVSGRTAQLRVCSSSIDDFSHVVLNHKTHSPKREIMNILNFQTHYMGLRAHG